MTVKELVAYARLGAIGRNRVEQAYWGPKSETFEYWSHAACVLPLEDWPAYAFKRRARREKGRRWHVLQEKDKTCNEVLARLRAEGPLTANELGGAKKGGPWWDWSETKIAAEWLLDIGELVCRERRGFARVYDLAERAIPAELLDQEWSDEDCAVRLVTAAGRSLGVATEADLAVYHGVPRALVRRALPSSGLTEVSVAGLEAGRLRRSRRAQRGRHPDAGPDSDAVPVRLAHLVQGTAGAPLRRAAPARGVHAEGEARLRLLRHAGARRDPHGRAWSIRAGAARCWWPSR